MSWLESKLQVAYKIEGAGPREEIWEIPLTVFKEAIINALSHRDYYEQGANIMIEMFDDRVEISNPGGLLPVVAKNFGHKSMTLPEQNFATRFAPFVNEFHTEGMFTVVFKRKHGIMSDTVNDTVNEKEREVLNLLRQQGGLNATEIAQELKKSIPTVKRYLSTLSKLDLIEFRGAPKIGGYYLK